MEVLYLINMKNILIIITALLFINTAIELIPNPIKHEVHRYKIDGHSSATYNEPKPKHPPLDTMYIDGCKHMHYVHDTIVDSLLVVLDTFVMPTEGHVSSGYGWRWGRMHYGVDYAGCNRDTSLSICDGVVRYARNGYNGGYGNLVVVRHFNGLETYYAHHWSLLVEEGDTVSAGDGIGIIGSTGRSTGPHLHFEVRLLGVPINPETIVGDSLPFKRDGFSYVL